ncbi:MAG: L,D-transpeptidase family protein [Bacteroidales bacterium]|nr:L,D-transpeptidase family protein [Bacteroidales bacterium]
MNKTIKYTLIITGGVIFILLIVLLLFRLVPEPPVLSVSKAREALSAARLNKAGTYSPVLFREAEALFDSAMANWKKENSRFIYFRDFERAEMFAVSSEKKSKEALQRSTLNSEDLKTRLIHRIDSVNNLIATFDRLFNSYPLEPEIRTRISKGKLLIKEAEIEFKKEEYLRADNKLIDSEDLLFMAFQTSLAGLKEYLSAFPQWKKWIDKTVSESKRTRSYSVIIDKFAHKCHIYYNGIRKYEFAAELGTNWVGDKRVKGDKATPEGHYRIVKKLAKSGTKYYKALLIDYPNREDTERFRKEISAGTLPRSADIGGLIEIHGNGGKGIDWTDGCVAITDSEMDIIFDILKVGTPVTLVGSAVDMHEILKVK